MTRIADITAFLRDFAPLTLAEAWDNVGLLIGDEEKPVSAVMTCLTLTSDVAAEAIARQAQLVVSHHPLLFRPVQRLTAETPEGRLLLDVIAAGIAVYSPHTGYDSAREGINQQLAELLGLTDIAVLRPQSLDATSRSGVAGSEALRRPGTEAPGPSRCSDPATLSSDSGVAGSEALRRPGTEAPGPSRCSDPATLSSPGAGRFGRLPQPMRLADFNAHVKQRLGVPHLQFVGDESALIERVGIACGSAAEFIADARRQGCQALVTGEARFHACLEARTLGIALVLAGHYATERPAMEQLAQVLADRFPDLTAWASERETDPIHGA